MDLNYIFATGNFLQSYRSDLLYFSNFQSFIIDQSNIDLYSKKGEGTFKNFINEYRVARNTDKFKTKELLIATINWLQKNKSIKVDEFAKYLNRNKLTHGKTALSLASKILFLSDPWNIYPYDNQARSALKHKILSYNEYYKSLINFKLENESEIKYALKLINSHVSFVEKDFKNKLFKIELIRENRFVDKILWSIGKNKNNT